MLNIISRMVAMLGAPELRKATYYESPTYVVKVSRQHQGSKRDTSTTFIVTCGKPNYLEREFIKQAKKAGEPFPIRKVQLKMWPKKKPH